MSSQCSFNCFEDPGELQANPDIGGTGVLVGFVGTAWFVVALVILHYFLALDPLKSPYWTPGDTDDDVNDNFTPNPIDEFVIGGARWVGQLVGSRLREGRASKQVYLWLGQRLSQRSRWENAFRTTILSVCDVQILTGLGILLSGYIGLFCYVSAYHWQVVVYLAWLSNLTHVACLAVLRGYLHHHRGERNIRFFSMTILWLALFPAIAPTAFFNWTAEEPTAADPASNARCYLEPGVGMALFDRNYTAIRADTTERNGRRIQGFGDSAALESAVLSSLLLFFSYFTRSIKLIPSWSHGFRTQVRGRASRHYMAFLRWAADRGERLPPAKILQREWLIVRPLMAVYLMSKLYTDILTSEFCDVYWLTVSAVWGTLQLREARLSVVVEDYDWGFGQILPVFLLLGPIVMTVQAVVAPSSKIGKPSSLGSNNIPLQTLSAPSTVDSQNVGDAHESLSNPTHQAAQENSTTPSQPPERGTSDIEVILETAYRDKKHISAAIFLSFAQVLCLTAIFFTGRMHSKEKASSFVAFSAVSIFVNQPVNTLAVLFIGLISSGQSPSLVFPFLVENQRNRGWPVAPTVVAAYFLSACLFVLFAMFAYFVPSVLTAGFLIAVSVILCYLVLVYRRISVVSRRVEIQGTTA